MTFGISGTYNATGDTLETLSVEGEGFYASFL